MAGEDVENEEGIIPSGSAEILFYYVVQAVALCYSSDINGKYAKCTVVVKLMHCEESY